MGKKHIAKVCFVILISVMSVYLSGCTGLGEDTGAQNVVEGFLKAWDLPGHEEAADAGGPFIYNRFRSRGYLLLTHKNEEMERKDLSDIRLSSNVSGTQAIVKAEYILITHPKGDMEQVESEVETVMYYRLENNGAIWLITDESETPLKIIASTSLAASDVSSNPLSTLSPVQLYMMAGGAILLFVVGFKVDKMEKAKRAGGGTKIPAFDTTGAAVMPKESVAPFVKCIPVADSTNKVSAIDVWIKNFSQSPYENFMIKADFPEAIAVKSNILEFGTIDAGATVKQTWIIKVNVAGQHAINNPTILMQYTGKKYTSTLDPVWIQST